MPWTIPNLVLDDKPVSLANMRTHGRRHVFVNCGNPDCHHNARHDRDVIQLRKRSEAVVRTSPIVAACNETARFLEWAMTFRLFASLNQVIPLLDGLSTVPSLGHVESYVTGSFG